MCMMKRRAQFAEIPSSKVKRSRPEKSSEKRHESDCESATASLSLPGAILSMFGSHHGNKSEDPSQHGGRVRSFPHMEGNWASHVYISVTPDERWNKLVDDLLLCLRPLNFERMDDLHISLSRTVCIRHHWIQPLTESLKENYQQMDSCLCDVGCMKLYTNDEKTRTFFSVEVEAEDTLLMQYVATADACLREFNLPPFYQNPSFHISLLWCVGDVVSQIPEKTKEKIQKLTGEFFSRHTDLSVVAVTQVLLKTGNKTFAFHLRSLDE
ncbi:hypothetical protein ACOMHN_018050 [Nucella lapillus]